MAAKGVIWAVVDVAFLMDKASLRVSLCLSVDVAALPTTLLLHD